MESIPGGSPKRIVYLYRDEILGAVRQQWMHEAHGPVQADIEHLVQGLVDASCMRRLLT